MRMVALKEFYYGKTRRAGEEFDLLDKHVKLAPVFKARGQATEVAMTSNSVDPDPLAGLRADAEAAGVKVDKRWGEDRLKTELAAAKAPAVQRRDMVAEQDGSAAEGMFRRYRRRDLAAEE